MYVVNELNRNEIASLCQHRCHQNGHESIDMNRQQMVAIMHGYTMFNRTKVVQKWHVVHQTNILMYVCDTLCLQWF